MTHTKGPWFWDKQKSDGAAPIIRANTSWVSERQKRDIAKVLYHNGSEDPEVRSNAEFIVRACNSHYELLEALETVFPHIMWGASEDGAKAYRVVKEAIAKAKGKGKS